MIVRVIMIGKTKQSFCAEGVKLYLDRLKHYTRHEWIELPDVPSKGLSALQIKQKEGELLIKNLKSEEEVILLDEKGETHSSRQFATWIQKKQNAGLKSLVLVIGGAHGFSDEVYALASSKLSLSDMTFPHELIRPFLAEQLYRAFTILKGENYHHD